MIYSKIIGTGSYLPQKILTNQELCKMVDTTDEWIRQRVGIQTRHIVGEDETLHTMAHGASLKAIEAAGISPQDIDLIIVGTVSADNVFPSAACLLQGALGITNGSPAFDVSAACSGFIYALNVADNFVRGGGAQNVLVVGADVFSKYLDWSDRSTCVLFGDGAGAVVLQASDTQGIVSTQLHAAGAYADSLYIKNPIWNNNEAQHVKMNGKDVFRHATTKLGDMVDSVLAKSGMQHSDIDWLIPHQANKRIIDAIAKKLKMSESKIIQTIESHGNTSSASVPLALDVAVRSGQIKRGDNLFLEAFGGGYAWGAALVQY
jgi:3-oxoacyl-[acyl-carrier-protein] synthase III